MSLDDSKAVQKVEGHKILKCKTQIAEVDIAIVTGQQLLDPT